MVYEVETWLILFAMNLFMYVHAFYTVPNEEGQFSEKRSFVNSFVTTTQTNNYRITGIVHNENLCKFCKSLGYSQILYCWISFLTPDQRWRSNPLRNSAVITLKPPDFCKRSNVNQVRSFLGTIVLKLNIQLQCWNVLKELHDWAIANGCVHYSYCIGTFCFVGLLQWQPLLEKWAWQAAI